MNKTALILLFSNRLSTLEVKKDIVTKTMLESTVDEKEAYTDFIKTLSDEIRWLESMLNFVKQSYE